jgi:hypothetical protein
MKKIWILIIIGLTGFVLHAQKINDPNAIEKPAKNFHGISVSNAFDIYLVQDNEEAVAVSAASLHDRDLITVEVKNGILYIGLEKKAWKWKQGNKKLKAYISIKQIDKLTISGACDLYLAGTLKADVLSINQSGASDFKQGKLDVNKLNIELSGASDMKVSGRVVQAKIEASGASSFKGYDLVTETCDITASGASDIKITVNKELTAHASGASDIRYLGEGVIKEIRSTGASHISKG